MILSNVVIVAGRVSAGGGRSYMRTETETEKTNDVLRKAWETTATVTSVKETDAYQRIRGRILRRLDKVAPDVGGIRYAPADRTDEIRHVIAWADRTAARYCDVARKRAAARAEAGEAYSETYVRSRWVIVSVPASDAGECRESIAIEVSEHLAELHSAVIARDKRRCQRLRSEGKAIARILVDDVLSQAHSRVRAAFRTDGGYEDACQAIRDAARRYHSFAASLRQSVGSRVERVEALAPQMLKAPAPETPAPETPAPETPAPETPAPAVETSLAERVFDAF